jgi:hypothetical protein
LVTWVEALEVKHPSCGDGWATDPFDAALERLDRD